jgi:ubiquinone/menaquinone biosynthesis C-methylase UbiE
MADHTARGDQVAHRYDRIARFYDAFEAPMDLLGGRRRRARCVAAATGRTLEVGIGTGRNIDLYPIDVEVTGIDISAAMLARAEKRAGSLHRAVRLERADVERLPYPDSSFDTVCATCVFCSVADPVAGLREVARVMRPDGQVRLLEHVRPRNRLLGWLADRLSPFTQRVIGPAINRRTEDNVRAAGLELVEVRRHGVWREILARPEGDGGAPANDIEAMDRRAWP